MRNDAPDANRSGVIFGVASQDSVAFDNCLVYGNDARHSVTRGDYSLEMTLYNGAVNGLTLPTVIPDGLVVKTVTDTNTGNELVYNTVRNTIAFGTNIMNTNSVRSFRRNDPGCYENNYTDAAAGEVAFSNGETWTYEESQIKSVTLETLNDNELGSTFVKTEGYPELAAAHTTDVVDNGDLQGAITAEFAREVIGEGQLFYYYKRHAMENIMSGTAINQSYKMELGNYVLPLPTSETDKRVM